MPEYLAPGVYVEEVSFRSKSIEGVSTTTTGFIGPTRYGPILLTPDVITSLVEFERTYGDRQQLDFGQGPIHNYMWHAVRAFFENGGKRVYVSRTFRPKKGQILSLEDWVSGATPAGFAKFESGGLKVYGRFPGAGGNMPVRLTLRAGANILASDSSAPGGLAVRGLLNRDVVILTNTTSPLGSPVSPLSDSFAIASWSPVDGWSFQGPTITRKLTALDSTFSIRVVSASVTIFPRDPNVPSFFYPDLALDRSHRMNGANDSLETQFALEQPTLGRARSVPIYMDMRGTTDGLAVLGAIAAYNSAAMSNLFVANSPDDRRSIDFVLQGGDDGDAPTVNEYEGVGAVDPTSRRKSGLKAFEDIDEISIVAAPGSTYAKPTSLPVAGLLISHAENMRYRIAVLDSEPENSIADVREMRGKIDSTYAALYYPWYTIVDPVTLEEIQVPPSGAVAGIYARNDINRAVYKAPANEVVETAIGLETVLNKSQQDILNPLGINCFRFFEGRGFRLWGARTISSDPEWKYVNLRRYFAYLEHSIDKGTQWAVFEPNGDLLWANVRRTIEDFLLNEWQNGALLGDKPEKAYFVKCDRSTMTQNDLDNGRLICLVGVSALRPAEFVIIRIGQWTADRKV